jgi:hypothetical protein
MVLYAVTAMLRRMLSIECEAVKMRIIVVVVLLKSLLLTLRLCVAFVLLMSACKRGKSRMKAKVYNDCKIDGK